MFTYRSLPDGEYEKPALIPNTTDFILTNGAVLLIAVINIVIGFSIPILFAFYAR